MDVAKEITDLSNEALNLLEEHLLNNHQYIEKYHNKIFDDEYKLSKRNLEERKQTLAKIKQDKTLYTIFRYLALSYLARVSLAFNGDVFNEDTMEKYFKMQTLMRALSPYSSSTEILHYFSVAGVKFIKPESEFAKLHLSKVSWQDILNLTDEEFKHLSPTILFDWKKITNSDIADSEIEDLYRKHL